MDRERYERAKALFLEACERSESLRGSFLERACGGDADLRSAVDSLLAFDEDDDLVLSEAVVERSPASSEPRFAPGDVFADRYRVVELLGRGGMGEVYHAVDLTLDVPVALKFPRVTDALHRARLRHEVRLARSVTHPAVARIYDIGEEDGEYFVSMEYIRGHELGALLRTVGRLTADRVVEIGYRLCQGIAAAHEAGVLHRDIKPSNVLIDEEGGAKLIDFGIATALEEGRAALAGTPSYMAPEQLSGGALTERTDVFAVGAVLYEMCTGGRPFDGADIDAIRASHRSPPPSPSSLGVALDEAFESTMMAALSEDPERRPADAADFARRIEGSRASGDGASPRKASTSSSEPERRQLTVLHCEVDDDDGRLDELDPEDLQIYADCVRQELERIATRYEGFRGEQRELSAAVHFGYPLAHEDSPARAVRAALELRTRLGPRLEELDRERTFVSRLSLGLHVGSAVVAASGAGEQVPRVTGGVFRRARQVSSSGEPGDVLISAELRRLVEGRFSIESVQRRGDSSVDRVIGVRDDRVENSEPASAGSPFVGREEELALLLERVRRARSGRGQILVMSGDGGVGKSRLVAEVRAGLDAVDFDWRPIQCSPYLRNAAFQPVVDMIRADLDERVPDDQRDASERFEAEGRARGLDAVDLKRLSELLSLRLDDDSGEDGVGPNGRREQTIQALADWLLRGVGERVPVVVLEDLHWADPSTIELLDRLSEAVAAESAIVIVTHRPDWAPTWPPRSHGTTVHLTPLTPEQAARLAREVGPVELAADAVEQIVDRADGIPLFVEELVRHAAGPNPTEIPDTLLDSLLVRLDRMGEAKPVAQCAAVLGRDFDLDVLVAICDKPREEVVASLDALVREDFLLRTRREGAAAFAFRHALLRDAAYSSLIRERRVALHSLALDALRSDGTTADQSPELLAMHAEFAGRSSLILEFRRRAAEQAAERLAHREAAMHAARAIDVLSWQPSTHERDLQELALQSLLAVSLLAIEGFTSKVTEQAFERARELCLEVGSVGQQLPILYGIFSYHEARADARCVAVADEMANLAASVEDPVLMNVSHASKGHFLLWNGELEACRARLREVRQTEDREAQRSLALRFGDDPVVCSPATLAAAECGLGEVVVGRRTLGAAVDRAEALGHPMTLAAVLTFSTVAAQILDDHVLSAELITRNEVVCAAGRFPSWGTASLAQRGWLEIRTGSPALGVARVESAIARSAAIGQRLFVSGMEVFVAQGELALGRLSASIAAADRAIAVAAETADRLFLPEAHRVRGDALRALDRPVEAEASFRAAIDEARSQRAAIFELRAARQLARPWAESGRAQEGRALVESALANVSDDESARDVRKAKALLATL